MTFIDWAAIKFQKIGSNKWFVLSADSHAKIFSIMKMNNISYNKNTAVQGFVTNKGDFVDRYEAAKIALNAGQITDASIEFLHSEDLLE